MLPQVRVNDSFIEHGEMMLALVSTDKICN